MSPLPSPSTLRSKCLKISSKSQLMRSICFSPSHSSSRVCSKKKRWRKKSALLKCVQVRDLSMIQSKSKWILSRDLIQTETGSRKWALLNDITSKACALDLMKSIMSNKTITLCLIEWIDTVVFRENLLRPCPSICRLASLSMLILTISGVVKARKGNNCAIKSLTLDEETLISQSYLCKSWEKPHQMMAKMKLFRTTTMTTTNCKAMLQLNLWPNAIKTTLLCPAGKMLQLEVDLIVAHALLMRRITLISSLASKTIPQLFITKEHPLRLPR